MPHRIRQYRALVVDDEADAAESLARVLRLMDCTASFITDPSRADAAIAQDRPNIVFIDLGMPGMDGYALARALRAKHPPDTLTLVAMTGYGTPQARADSRQAGFDAHLVKPATFELIQATLVQLLDEAGR